MDSIYGSKGTLGRNWATADKASLSERSDCVRVTLTWNDGETLYFLEDTKQDALKTLAGLGFIQSYA